MLVLSALTLVVVLAFVVFSVDLGFLALTKAHLQNASDAATFAAAIELSRGVGSDPELSSSGVASVGREAAFQVASSNASGEKATTFVDRNRDVRFGQLQWSPQSNSWVEVWNEAPFTLVEVTVHRETSNGVSSPDGPVPLFFGPVIGHAFANLTVRSAAAIVPGGGFRIDQNSSAKAAVLPIALDVDSWNQLMQGNGNDNYTWNEALNRVDNWPDGTLEVDIYPTGNKSLPPGNRGTVDLGNPNNSTADLKRQIEEGLNADDLSWFGGTIRFDEPLELNGDTGLSAGIESALKSVIGEVRAVPLFTSVSGPGNNANYVIDRFVGVRIMDVKLSGNPNTRRVVVEPAFFSDSTVVRGTSEIRSDSIFTRPILIR